MFFELEQLAYYIIYSHQVQVAGKPDRVLDYRYFLQTISKDENDSTFNLRLALKHNLHTVYEYYLYAVGVYWRSEHILIGLKYAKHFGSK